MSNTTITTATMEDGKPVLVPKLRFPEFRDAPEWKHIPLYLLAIRAKQKNRDEKIDRVLTNSAEFGVVDQRDFFDKDIATQGKLEGYFVVELGSYVYNPRISSTAPVGPISKNKIGTGVMSPLYTVFKFKDERNDFYEHFFKTTGWHTYMRQASSTGARHDRMAISSDDFMAMPLPVSSADEQQKIAECLSSVDELMTAQARKLDVLKSHKKGLMQQLFPREGETQPRLRFPEFQNAGEWVNQSIGDFGRVVTGSTPSTAQALFYGGGISFVSPADISDMRFVEQTKTTLTTEGFAETRHIRAGSVLFVSIGSTIGKVAQNVYDCATNQQINAVIPSSKHSGGFVYFALSLASERIAMLAGRQAVPIINKSLFSSVRIFVPKLPEQQHIASCLGSLDAFITAETKKLEAIKTHKRALMQQLFPSMEGV
ncbi:restriction endonuclease subunit S [Rheinheimera baltica]|uniref:restriction endonuclease subunit S n=1 Tax=Rheinheimera baltica TaxID=67576 RepID=UPI0003FA9DCB|nr:restriction endonuclease subunit S [Rheinheimera baltica]